MGPVAIEPEGRDHVFLRNVCLFLLRNRNFRLLQWLLPRKQRLAAKAVRQLRKSDWFDAHWYIRTYGSQKNFSEDPVIDYVFFGAERGRNPCSWFDTEYYIKNYPEVANSGANPFYDYITRGHFLGYQVAEFGKMTVLQALMAFGAPISYRSDHVKGPPPAALGPDLKARVSNRERTLDLVVIDHSIGGGANAYRRRVVADALGKHSLVAVLTYDHPSDRYKIKISYKQDFAECVCKDTLDVVSILSMFDIKSILINNLATYKTPMLFIKMIDIVRRTHGASVSVAYHDFFPACPTVNLLNVRGVFCGVPEAEECASCIKEVGIPVPLQTQWRNIEEWRSVWGEFLASCDEVIFFSESSFHLTRRAYPFLDSDRCAIRPHVVDYVGERQFDLPYEQPLHIAVVGHIVLHKGAGVVNELKCEIKRRAILADIFVIGDLDRNIARMVQSTGPYRVEELPHILRARGVNMCLVPSICPETFCFVAAELIKLRMPLAVFNLGAQAERVREYEDGLILNSMTPSAALDELLIFHESLKLKYRTAAQ